MMNRVEINEEMTAQVNGGTFTPNKFYESQYNACGIEVRTHFIDPDEFVLPDGRITNADEANKCHCRIFPTTITAVQEDSFLFR